MFRKRFSADTYRLMQPALGGCVGGQRIPVAPGGRAVRPGAVGRRATFFCGDAFYTFTVHLACGDFSCCFPPSPLRVSLFESM